MNHRPILLWYLRRGGRPESVGYLNLGGRVVGTPAGVEKVSSGECMAAWSLIRWGGASAVLGGLSTTFVKGLLPSPYPPNDRE